ncbi:MAG TPA: MFS transporter [Streptosporangiaceae bacterium]|jgi:MFS family permease
MSNAAPGKTGPGKTAPGKTALRNRDFLVLSAAQGLSRLGTQVSGIAFPLLVLRLTGSPALAGLTGFAEGVAVAVVLLPGGAIADRWNRRAVMVAADTGCALTLAVLAAAIAARAAGMSLVIPAAVVAAGLGASFSPAAGAALRTVLSDAELPGAMSVIQARNAATALAGPALGGLLFEITPSLPFALDAASYAVSLLGSLAVRASLAAPDGAQAGRRPLLGEVLRGVRFIAAHRFLRVTMANAAVLNFAFTGVLLCLIVTIVKGGSTGFTAGTVVAFVGLGSLIGSLLAPAAKRRLSLRQAVVLVTWSCAVLVAVMAVARGVPVLAAATGAAALLVPALNVIVITAQTMITPNAMQGRVQSAISFIALSISPLGAAAAGFLLQRWPPAVAFGSFAAILAVLALVSTAATALREAPGPAAGEPASPSAARAG